jgi:hypothetical protein
MQNKTPEALKAEWTAIVAQVAPALVPGEPATIKIGEAITKFIAYPKSLTIAMKGKAGPLKLADFKDANDPAVLFSKIDINAFAESDPNQPPASAAPPLTVSAAAAPAATAAAKLSGLAAWNALVGNTITGKSSDGDALTEYYLSNGRVKQLIDDETATGKWALKGNKVCFIYPDDEEESCYKVEVFGDVATFTDDDGDGRRYQILKGNPKGL